MIRVLFIFGTRPEAIKLCPLIGEMTGQPEFDVRVCITAQHRQLLDQVLATFGVTANHDLNLMSPGQSLFQSTSRIISALEPVIEEAQPHFVIVQGDTTTTFCGALAAFYSRVPVGHVEAGLRTGDPAEPFPEELNRLMTSRLANLHFAATNGAAANLRAEGVPDRAVSVTGNTGIDAVLTIAAKLERGEIGGRFWRELDPAKRLILVTAHRRESFGEGFAGICEGLQRIAQRGDVQILYPVHPNPNILRTAYRELSGIRNLTLVEPLDYVSFVDLMRRAYFLLTDSGGVQEEGPSLGKPILVLRNKTERPEAVEAGTVRLVGTEPNRIAEEANLLLDDAEKYRSLVRVHNPYGDGLASRRISGLIRSYFAT